MRHKLWPIILSASLFAASTLASEKERYFSAQDLERECTNKSQTCYAVIYGVQGALMTASTIERMKNVICLPDLSADDIRIHFLSYAIDRREQIKGMYGGSALFTMLYEKYPCPGERKLREADDEKMLKELSEKARASKR